MTLMSEYSSFNIKTTDYQIDYMTPKEAVITKQELVSASNGKT